MPAKDLIFKVLCLCLCMVLSLSSPSEDSTLDFIEHVLRIPYPEKVLNSVLGHLEKSRQGGKARERLTDDADCNEPYESLPEYTESMQISRERGLRQLDITVGRCKDNLCRWGYSDCNKCPCGSTSQTMAHLLTCSSCPNTCTMRDLWEATDNACQKYYPICHTERKIKRLNTNEYEYRPAYYEEVRCATAAKEDLTGSNEICSSLGFSCVQWNNTIHLTRRRYSSDCWETKTMVIPAGCECMWPFHRLGDINFHI